MSFESNISVFILKFLSRLKSSHDKESSQYINSKNNFTNTKTFGREQCYLWLDKAVRDNYWVKKKCGSFLFHWTVYVRPVFIVHTNIPLITPKSGFEVDKWTDFLSYRVSISLRDRRENFLLEILSTLLDEITFWSFLRVKGLITVSTDTLIFTFFFNTWQRFFLKQLHTCTSNFSTRKKLGKSTPKIAVWNAHSWKNCWLGSKNTEKAT